MAPTIGINIAVNNSATDVDVENDSAAWTTKIGKVEISGGGGSWWKTAQPYTCRVDVAVPWEDAHKMRTVTVAIIRTGDTKTVFHGSVVSMKTSTDGEYIQVDCADEMSALLSRRARTSANDDSGVRDLLGDIETAHGLTMTGDASFPASADMPNLDRPKQKGASNGEWLRKALVGTGINVTGDWIGTFTAPELLWQPDYFDVKYATVNTSLQTAFEVGYPWLLNYTDVGLSWQDYTARLSIDGEDDAGNQYWGYCQLADAADRAALGHRDVSLSSWIDTAVGCRTAARRLLAYVGEPAHLRMLEFTVPIEAYRDYCDDNGCPGSAPDGHAFSFAGLMCGDRLDMRDSGGGDPFGDGHADFGDWPTEHPELTSPLYLRLELLWYALFRAESAAFLIPTEYHTVRSVRRVWHPTGGWFVSYGTDPVPDSGLTSADMTDYDQGTY